MQDYTKLAVEQLAAEYKDADIQTHWPTWVTERARALKAEAELEAFKREVSDAVKLVAPILIGHGYVGVAASLVADFTLPDPDPEPTLADVLVEAGMFLTTEGLIEAAARLGVEIIVKRKEG